MWYKLFYIIEGLFTCVFLIVLAVFVLITGLVICSEYPILKTSTHLTTEKIYRVQCSVDKKQIWDGYVVQKSRGESIYASLEPLIMISSNCTVSEIN